MALTTVKPAKYLQFCYDSSFSPLAQQYLEEQSKEGDNDAPSPKEDRVLFWRLILSEPNPSLP